MSVFERYKVKPSFFEDLKRFFGFGCTVTNRCPVCGREFVRQMPVMMTTADPAFDQHSLRSDQSHFPVRYARDYAAYAPICGAPVCVKQAEAANAVVDAIQAGREPKSSCT